MTEIAPPYEPELTLDQVAERLRMKPVTLRRFLLRIHFLAIQAGDTLLFTEADYTAIRDARRKVRSRSTGAARAAPGPAPESSADVQRRLAKLRAEYWPTKGKSPKKTSSRRRGRVVAFPKRP